MDGWIAWIAWAACIVGAYLVGSIPFGVLIGRARGIDIREHGSRNIGATNVGRVLGRRAGAVCFALDLAKGGVPVLVAGIVTGVLGRPPRPGDLEPVQMWLWLAVALAAIVGHMAPIFLGFRGGKGVATSFGAMLAMWPLLTLPTLGAMVVWYATLRLTRYVSLSSMVSAASLPIWYALSAMPPAGGDVIPRLLHASPPLVVTCGLTALVMWRHRANIERLRQGTEPRVGQTRDDAS
jgi:glycerol-3-phosphate acyltransferase PlsY